MPRVLVVDDEPDVVELLTEFLQGDRDDPLGTAGGRRQGAAGQGGLKLEEKT
ncbi:MAG: response regulator [candidate division NC10 bacterium]|nr:response regulator [candidate division NC10 bacterium]